MTGRKLGPGVVKRYGKAIGSAAAALIASITTALLAKPGTPGLGDLTTVDWLAAVGFMLAALGITAVIPKGDELARLDRQGIVRAGPAAKQDTGDAVGAGTTVNEMVKPEPV
jgi:hypothetical protein